MPVTELSGAESAATPVAGASLRAKGARALRRGLAWLRGWTPALAVVAGAAALALGGWPAVLLAIALVAVLGRLAMRIPAPAASLSVSVSPLVEARLSQQVVPVWQRSVEAAKSHSARSMDLLLESFANVSGHLDKALAVGGTDPAFDAANPEDLLNRHATELDTLLATTRAAVQLKDQMFEQMQAVAAELGGMLAMARDVQSISRATHLLAMNASVEATRAGAAGAGMAVVAQEVRGLAAQSRQAGNQLAKHLSILQDRIESLRRQARRHETDDDDLQLQAEQAARQVLRAVLGSVAEATRASRELRQASRQVQVDLEKIFVGLQSQDRLSQMLTSVTDDMVRYTAWLQGHPDPAGSRPTEWLARLEASYTMEDLRTAHHGNVVIDKAASVEFF